MMPTPIVEAKAVVESGTARCGQGGLAHHS